jgi:hypothetical protein
MSLISTLRNRFFKTIITVLVMFQLINMSIDATDPMPHCEDLSVNEIESCVELIVEVFLEHGNAIQETDDDDGSGTKPVVRLVLFSVMNAGLVLDIAKESSDDQSESPYLVNFKSVARSIVSPPPKNS